MSHKKYLISFVAVLVSVFGFYAPDASAACQLNSVAWAKQEAVVGEEVLFNATGTGCSGWEVSFNIYEEDPGPDDFIATVKATFTTNPTSVIAKYTFTAADYQKGYEIGEGDGEMIIEAVAGSSKVNTSSSLTLREPTSGSCQLSTAQWRWNFSAQPILGSPLHMVVNAVGCPGWGVSFKIYSDDVGPNYEMDTVNGTFDSTGTKIDVKWIANNRNDNRPVSSRLGNYNFYFIASAGTSKATSNTVKIPANSQSGCINCHNILAPSTCDCADGFSGPRGTFSSCDAICSAHIGDAKSDATGGGGGNAVCGNNQCESGETQASCPSDCRPGQDQGFSFSIPNPLKGGADDLAGLVKVIAQWLFNLSIPIAVIMIIYAGILFLTAQGNPTTITKAKTVLWYAVVGLAIILIGSGFVTLIQSILELGGSSNSNQQQQQNQNNQNTGTGVGAVGNKCSRDRDCVSGLKCKNSICQRANGNLVGEPCNGGTNCAAGLACDQTSAASVVIDGQTLGACFQP